MQVRKAAAVTLSVLSVIFRVCAIALGALTVLLCFPSAAARLNITGLVLDLSAALPDVIRGYGLITSPFGGVFHFDFLLAMSALLALDYVGQRVSFELRRR